MPRIVLNNWNQGGLSDGDYQGPSNSLADLTACDVHTEPGIIAANKALTRQNVTAGTAKIDALVKKVLVDTEGTVWFFSGEDSTPAIWGEDTPTYDRYDPATYAALTNMEGVSDACEYKKFIFYFNGPNIGYWTLSGTGIPTNGDADWYSSLTDTDHQCIVKNDVLYFSDVNVVKAIEGTAAPTVIGNFTGPTTVLTLDNSQTITAMGEIGNDLLIAVKDGNGGSRIYRWDAVTANLYDSDDYIPEFRISAFIPADNLVMVVSNTGRIYQYDGYQYSLIKRLKLETDKPIVNFNAVSIYEQRPLIGFTNTGASDDIGGVYSFGNYSNSYPRVLLNEFISSPQSRKSLEIGAIGVKRTAADEQLYVSWHDFNGAGDDEYGVDLVQVTSSKYDSSSFTTRIIESDRLDIKHGKVYINYKTLADGTDLTLKVSVNQGAFTEIPLVKHALRRNFEGSVDLTKATSFQLKVEFTTVTSNSPEIESIFIDYA